MWNNFSNKIESVLRIVRIKSEYSYTWFNERESIAPMLIRNLSSNPLNQCLNDMLCLRLYKNFYCTGYPVAFQNTESYSQSAFSKSGFLKELSASNAGKGYVENDWIIHSETKDCFIVHKNGLKISVAKKNCQLVKERYSIGEIIGVMMPKEYFEFAPGYYLAMSNEYFSRDINSTIIRIYWNLTPQGAVKLVKEITTVLNDSQIPFRLKLINHPEGYIRCDSTVLYLGKNNFEKITGLLKDTYLKLAQYTKEQVPVFTKQLLPGLGLSEDPGDGKSFGMNRCSILADAIVDLFNKKIKPVDKAEFVTLYFTQKKIQPETPYLNPGSSDIYALNFALNDSKKTSVERTTQKSSAEDNEIFLNAAYEIGILLCSRAFRSKGKCNWIGYDVGNEADFSFNKNIRLVYKPLGPDFYSGTIGIALFLAELQSLVNNSQILETCLAAVRNAISMNETNLSNGVNGLYDGSTGILLGAAYIGRLLNDEQLLDTVNEMMHNFICNFKIENDSDLISGNAGIIAGLLVLRLILDRSILLDCAVRLGDELIRKAVTEENCCHWKSEYFPANKSLTGFSHGTAGIGYALLELYDATGENKYKDFSDLAFNYETKNFKNGNNKFADFRGVPAKAKLKNRHLSYPVFWCHGAAGIALSRVRAYGILRDEKYRFESLIALKATMDETKRMLNSKDSNFCLCHGLAGNASVLLNSFQTFGNEFSHSKELAREIAFTGIERYLKPNHTWQFGMLGSNSPGLMTGLSGAGHFYLSLFKPEIPSVLIIESDKILQRLETNIPH